MPHNRLQKLHSPVQHMCCRLLLPFNRWQCEPRFTWDASMPSDMDDFKITTCNFCNLNCLTVYLFTYLLFLFFYPEKVAECAVFCTILQDKHTREQPTATIGDSCKVNVWDKNITFPVQHPSRSSGELQPQITASRLPPTFQDTDSLCYSGNLVCTLQWFYRRSGLTGFDNNYSLYMTTLMGTAQFLLDTVSRVLGCIYMHPVFI